MAYVKFRHAIMKRILLSVVFLISLTLSVSAENYPYRSDGLWGAVPDHAVGLYKTV